MEYPTFPLVPVSGAQLSQEIGGGAEVQVCGDWLRVVGIIEADRDKVQGIIAAHVPIPDFGKTETQKDAETATVEISKVRAKAKAVIAGTDTFTAAQMQKVVAHLILRVIQ